MQSNTLDKKIAALILGLAGLFAFVTVVIADTTATSVVVSNAAPSLSISFNGGNAITLTEATYTYATATVTVTDSNGCATINYLTATAFLASTTALSGTPCAQNDSSCYPTSSTTASGIPANLSDTNCVATTTGNQCTTPTDTSVQFDCGFKLWYIARATDSGAPTWASSIWTVAATTSDGIATTTASNTSQTVEINTLAALDLTGTLSYGTKAAGTDTDTTNSTTTATTTGNIAIDANISGTDMSSGGNTLAVANQEYKAIPFDYGNGVDLSTTPTAHEFTNNAEPSSTTTALISTSTVSWGINIPSGQANGTYTGTNTFTATND